MDRITKTDLHQQINFINRKLKPYNIELGLSIAYGGYRLIQKRGCGGEHDLSYRLTARELYYCLNSIDNLLEIMPRSKNEEQ